MIKEINRNNFSIIIADEVTDEFEFISQGAKSENAKEYMSLQLGGKYEYSVILCYNGMPYSFFMMCNGGRYPENTLRIFTKLYTIPHFRAGQFQKFIVAGDNPYSTALASHGLVCNFIEDILPETNLKPYDFYFYSREHGDTTMLHTVNKLAKVKWSMTDDLYFVGSKEQEPRAWKHLIYKGDLSQFTKPSMTVQEFNERFYPTV